MSLNILINVGEITLYVTKLTSIILVRNVAFYTILLINVRENRKGGGRVRNGQSRDIDNIGQKIQSENKQNKNTT